MFALPDPVASFSIARLPRVEFGCGAVTKVAAAAAGYGSRVLLVLGARSFTASSHWPGFESDLRQAGLTYEIVTVAGEPSPELVDAAVLAHRRKDFDVVVGVGGGSVLDAAKAIAGLLPRGNSVMDHLEGVGRGIPYHGPATPFIAVPTTAGTGSEATKNAVLSVHGSQGFKKSFRHDALVPQVAIVDPDLLASCPPALIAANGMDALTQLIESYVSTRSNPLTDALAWSGMVAFKRGFFDAWRGTELAAVGRSHLAYASLLSGITLAQTGLGSVHGVAAPLGAFFPIPHGVACGTLLAEATALNLTALKAREPSSPALSKYRAVAGLLVDAMLADAETADSALVALLRNWVEELRLPRLADFGVTLGEVPRIAANSRGSSMLTNPVSLTDAEIETLIESRV